jgi:uncharacterized protein YdaU (DUF1376 family)
MSEKTWMPLFIGDYLADTQHLSAEEHGAYILIIMHYWRNGGAIKNDKNLIKNIAKISQKKLQNVLAFFEEKNGLLFHKRIDAELTKAAENNEKNKERTRKATEARQQKLQRDVEEKPNVTCNVTFTPSPSPSPEVSKKEILSSSEQESARVTDDDFSKKELETLPEPEPPEPPEKPWHQTYHQVEFHPQFNEVVKYITDRLPKLKRTSATEVNRWLQEGVSPPDIYATVDYCISASAQPIYSFSYFSDAVMSCIRLKKELAEQDERMRKKYAESN